MKPVIRRVMETARTTRIVDLCSGGSGPLLPLVRELAADGLDVHATLTDLFPNAAAFSRIAAESAGRIDFATRPIDARQVPAEMTGLRTIFNGFHHLRPPDARAVLHAAAAARQPIAIFEVSERTPRALISIFLTPFVVWLVTPFMRPFRWGRLFWTYLLPLVPLTCLWDGIVSQLRAYTLEDLDAMCAGSAPMRWERGKIPIARGRANLTCLTGIPIQ
jgi:hypothetical protein